MLILNESNILAANDFALMRQQMREALRRFSIGDVTNFPRQVVNLTGQRALGFMPAFSEEIIGYKAVSVHPENRARNLNPHQGVVVLADALTGQPRALLDGSTVTALRTAAISAAATEELSRTHAKVLGIIGAGSQAFQHVLALSQVRPFEKILIYSRTLELTQKLIHELRNHTSAELKEVTSPTEVLFHSDVLVTCTSSTAMLCSSGDLPLGIHVNAIGACRPGSREFNLKTRSSLKIYMDSKASCLSEASEIIDGLKTGNLSETTLIGEIGECFDQQVPGRTTPDDITFFKSVGLGITDLFAADLLVRRAIDMRLGTHINFGARV